MDNVIFARIPILYGVIFVMFSCAPGIDGARQTIVNAEQLQISAGQALKKFDAIYQDNIADAAEADCKKNMPDCEKVRELAKKQIAEYRTRRQVAIDCLDAAVMATVMARLLIPVVETGTNPAARARLDNWVRELSVLAIKLFAAFNELGIKRFVQ